MVYGASIDVFAALTRLIAGIQDEYTRKEMSEYIDSLHRELDRREEVIDRLSKIIDSLVLKGQVKKIDTTGGKKDNA